MATAKQARASRSVCWLLPDEVSAGMSCGNNTSNIVQRNAAHMRPPADESINFKNEYHFLTTYVTKMALHVTGLVGRCRMPSAEDWLTRV